MKNIFRVSYISAFYFTSLRGIIGLHELIKTIMLVAVNTFETSYIKLIINYLVPHKKVSLFEVDFLRKYKEISIKLFCIVKRKRVMRNFVISAQVCNYFAQVCNFCTTL